MPQSEEKTLPNSVFSTSFSVIEIPTSTLPNSVLPIVEESLKRLSESTGNTLIQSTGTCSSPSVEHE